jgi:MFS family permease
VLLCAAGGVRAAAISTAGVVIAVHFASRGLSAAEIGAVIGAGMAATAAGTVLIGRRGDRWGRRRSLIVVGLLSTAGAAPLVIGGLLKIVYDLALYRSFRHLRPPEER